MMAGLYDRMRSDGLDGAGGDRVNVHLIAEALSAYVGNVFTKQQVIDVINSTLAKNGSQPLRGEDLTDIDAIAAVVDGKATNTGRLIYGFCSMTPAFLAAELDEIPEASWRATLEIP